MLRALALALLLALPAHAEACHGQNLIAALPAADLAALTAKAEVPFAHGNLWQATREGQEIILAGTYHLNDPRFAPILALLTPHLAASTALLVEAGPLEEAALKAKVAKDPSLMLLTKGPTLPEQLSPEDWASLSVALRARGMPPMMAAKMQPWLLASMLEMPACMFPITAANSEGLDKQLMTMATAKGIPIKALEPSDAILSIFGQFAPAQQLDMLMQTVATDAQSDDMATTLSDSYFSGESRLFWEFSALQMATLPGMTAEKAAAEMALVDRAMISSRNANWIAVLEAEAAKGPVLAAFGALHLPGDRGVLNLLAQRGWHLSPLAP
jgi:uncharacterized protein YbaP (TraB family)